MEEKISVKDILQTLRQRLGLIVIITAAAVALAAGISYVILTPVYEASTQLLVNQSAADSQQEFTSDELETSRELINTYSVIITSSRILDPALEELNLIRSVDELRSQVSVSDSEESQIVTIRVQDENPDAAVEIANTIGAVFQEDIIDIMNVDNVSLLSPAELEENPSPVAPDPVLNMGVAFVVGLVLAVGLAFLLEFLDRTIKSEEDVEEKLGIPILASISTMPPSRNAGDLTSTKKQRGRETYGA
ncbi:YveK family protein [Alkalicoccus halolimnae]|uniref:Wzz/FepE/Etk N-terminal domain-containing protein n=1 Tax=Alkalicoccus halolimnae TaxID=1667239 RepID=A0A5C7FA54_9BACI|nr:Wzz/FepE/Etk N-terminal domain-containing protein [Alkalicoccus halolimnae]TXF87003.1 capsular biosynthesis protein [Alkalicoccus halolimnae]